jgi:serine phosphatase RsbU (regulator of sigma subunit)
VQWLVWCVVTPLTIPGNILDKCRELVLETFARSEGGVKDGMDISLCSWNKTTNVLKWAGANNPLWIIRNGECITFKADKQPIGKTENPVPFQTHIIPFQSGDMLYLFTDGFSDQFGGEKGKKLKQANFQQLLIEMAGNTTAEQNIRLNVEYQKWKGKFEQTDDVCVIGIRI